MNGYIPPPEVVEEYRENGLAAAAKLAGKSVSTIWYGLRRLSPAPRRRHVDAILASADSYQRGESVAAIARRAGCNRRTVESRLLGRPSPPKRPLRSLPLCEVNAYLGGESSVTIARRNGTSPAMVLLMLRELGVEIRRPGWWGIVHKLSPRRGPAARLRAEGLSLREIGRRLGISGERVRQLLL